LIFNFTAGLFLSLFTAWYSERFSNSVMALRLVRLGLFTALFLSIYLMRFSPDDLRFRVMLWLTDSGLIRILLGLTLLFTTAILLLILDLRRGLHQRGSLQS
jgi:hypothetical protein